MIKVYQLAFIGDLVIDEALTNYNINIISIKADLSIKMTDLRNYKILVNFCTYQRLVRKLIYFLYSTKLDITFVVKQLNKYNANLKKSYL